MLTELRIADLGVIGDATIEPGPGFTAVTGETGAGKTMIVTGLALLAGAKSDPKLVRTGAARALVEGRWKLPGEVPELDGLGAEVDDGEVLLSRQLGANRSRMSVGGAQVPLNVGAGLVGEWITIHGQSEQLRLGTAERQLEVLDRYAGSELAAELADYRSDFSTRRAAMVELAELTTASQARARELDLLRFGLEEIEKVDPQPGEDVQLAAETLRLQAVDDLRQAAQAALVALTGEEDSYAEAADAISLVASARKALAAGVEKDPELLPIAEELGGASAALTDVGSALSSYLASLDADPLRLEWITGRRAELAHLTRKYGDTVDAVLGWGAEAAERVLHLDAGEGRIEELRAQVAGLDGRLALSAARITGLRQVAADKLAALVAEELKALAMPKARLSFDLKPVELGPNGADQVTLLFSANPGSAPGPLGKVASGGELSRVRLALEVVLAADTTGETFIFDEVDAGVGGAVALEIGRRLARLANTCQVIVVTHLAQVAVFADRHYVVAKADDGSVTTSGVRLVVGEDRLEVLAQMMGGLDGSDSALAHARELLDSVRA
ncbi:DNA repair protein RecN [Propionicimonas sp.]|uniref:DNA repair protein RecN n=1 Tax=Propionicimonas sp. TaxID=1955623 RepID=UPI0017F4A187|nr:DNA repair protein RecN [Propionicimonas sp.]MBU3977169.1 DNA repair protein RecN [Actinomycetota bacterium]MBA3021095.1 DNA repair protein RecN [Propionicimonas sp.]MBU3985679.1 DNA repair protein RecN [Actinomycetota bacterium]MBU4008464.1 DNA repair protein RecN [Actinomycetota bacterium]MBU4066386.1 DNA repair protein RecN [Actinomycetota bacterium]